MEKTFKCKENKPAEIFWRQVGLAVERYFEKYQFIKVDTGYHILTNEFIVEISDKND
jgi:hypothetical protein